MKIKLPVLLVVACFITLGLAMFRTQGGQASADETARPLQPTEADLAPVPRVEKSEAEWKALLTPAQFAIMRGQQTERACSSILLTEHRRGVFRCAGCGAPLFASDGKFESGTGWPSFTRPFIAANLVTEPDHSLGMEREAVLCARCGSHLGHVFDDGPPPAGQRYCINGLVLKFEQRP